MSRYIALLRAVNVGGTGKLPMTDLKAICIKAGFQRVETYIASGNVVFDSTASAAKVKAELESRLLAYSGKSIDVLRNDGHSSSKSIPRKIAFAHDRAFSQ